ncbi:MAG: hypothetical protein C3F13_03720 [Anaerolineales bacterium]|nr:MAG: hypothetical protein C3F13_03720 [Anaerolineales bacterium]
MRGLLEWITGNPWRYFPLIFLLSLTIRIHQLNDLTREYPDYLAPTSESERGAIAISLLRTGEFANPYAIPTGPTAHLPPLVPLIESLIYRIFGLTSQAGSVSALFILFTASVLYGLLPWFSERLGTGGVAGMIGGLIGAFGGLEKTIAAKLPGHGEYLTGIILGLLMVAFLRRWKGQNEHWLRSLLLGLGIGLALHLQPALLPVILGFMVFELVWLKNPGKWVRVGVLTIGVVMACLPWGIRNYQVFHEVFFIRSNLGLELRMGNNDKALPTFAEMDAIRFPYLHPRASFQEAQRLLELGEMEYMHQARDEALTWIKAHPARFLWLTGQRFINLWIGPPYWMKYFLDVFKLTVLALIGACLALPRIRIPQRAALLIPLATYPLIYYILAYEPRYRIPIDWIVYTLTGVVVWMLIGGSLGSAIKEGQAPINLTACQ